LQTSGQSPLLQSSRENHSVKLGVFGVTRRQSFFAEVTECRRKNLWQDDLSAESFQIILS
jgi:hypothetical protein